MKKLAYAIRVATTAPILAFALYTLIYLLAPPAFSLTDLPHYLCSLLFYTLLPLLSYPIAHFVPTLRRKGRPAERKLAILFSVIGYVCGVVFLAFFRGTRMEWLIALTYLFSGILIAVSSLLHLNASGHACGVAGPAAVLVYCLGMPWLACFLVLIPVFWASGYMKRHSPAQLVSGSIIPVAVLLVLLQCLPV